MNRVTRVLVTREERIALTDATGITLDGAPARISGYNNSFATVRSADNAATFAWLTAANIVADRDGKFRS